MRNQKQPPGTAAATVRVRRGRGLSSVRLKENLSGYLLVAPNLFGFLVFTLQTGISSRAWRRRISSA